MDRPLGRGVGWSLVLLGLLIVLFSPQIVAPVLQGLPGRETVAARNGTDQGRRTRATDPAAMKRWTTAVAGVGLLMGLAGVLVLYRHRRLPGRHGEEERGGETASGSHR